MLSLGFDRASEMDNTLMRLNSRDAEGSNVLLDSIAYGIASILQVQEQVRCHFNDHIKES